MTKPDWTDVTPQPLGYVHKEDAEALTKCRSGRLGISLFPPADQVCLSEIDQYVPVYLAPIVPQQQPGEPQSVRYEWSVYEMDGADDVLQAAAGDAPTADEARRDARHYYLQYAEDGPCRYEVKRITVIEEGRNGEMPPEQPGEPQEYMRGYSDAKAWAASVLYRERRRHLENVATDTRKQVSALDDVLNALRQNEGAAASA